MLRIVYMKGPVVDSTTMSRMLIDHIAFIRCAGSEVPEDGCWCETGCDFEMKESFDDFIINSYSEFITETTNPLDNSVPIYPEAMFEVE